MSVVSDMTETVTFTVLRTASIIRISAKLGEGTTREDAQAIVALFPKSVKLVASVIDSIPDDDYSPSTESGYIRQTIDLSAKKGNSANESGLRRYATFVKHARKLGFALVADKHSTESIEVA
jgi:hypothetical protein